MCSSKALQSVGGLLYILGLVTAGVMFIVIGVEYDDNSTNNDFLRTYFWVYAIAMFLGTVGLVLENGDRFCGEEEVKQIDYFGGIFQVVAGFAWAGFGAGIAFFYADTQYFDGLGGVNMTSADERENLAWLSGIAAIFYAFGSLFVLKELLCCEGFRCGLDLFYNLGNVLLMILLVVFWFLFADALGEQPGVNAGDDDRRNWSFAIGVFFLIAGLSGVLKIFMVLCCSGKPRPPKPQPPVDPGYGDDTTQPTYGNQPAQGY